MLTIKPKTRKEIYLAYLSGDMSLELPEPLTRDEVNLYNLCKNKAYGEYTTVKEVLAECQPVFSAGSGDDAFDTFYIMNPFEIVPDEKYIVSWNGVEYLSTAAEIGGVQVLGNLSDLGMEDTGEPFVIQMQGGQPDAIGYAVIVPYDGSTTLTISIRQEVTEVQKISGKYVEGMGWSEIGEKVLADNVIIPPNANEDEMEIPGVVLSVGEVYTVIYDGVRYENLVCFEDERFGWPCIGSAPNDFSEYGFCILTNGGKTLCSRYSTGGQNTVTVIGRGETIHPIDPKYLPVTTFYAPYSSDGGVRLCDESGNEITYEQAKAAIDTMVRIWVENQGGYVYPICVADRADETHVEFCCVSFSAGLSSAIFIGGEPTGGGGGPV